MPAAPRSTHTAAPPPPAPPHTSCCALPLPPPPASRPLPPPPPCRARSLVLSCCRTPGCLTALPPPTGSPSPHPLHQRQPNILLHPARRCVPGSLSSRRRRQPSPVNLAASVWPTLRPCRLLSWPHHLHASVPATPCQVRAAGALPPRRPPPLPARAPPPPTHTPTHTPHPRALPAERFCSVVITLLEYDRDSTRRGQGSAVHTRAVPRGERRRRGSAVAGACACHRRRPAAVKRGNAGEGQALKKI